MAETGRSSPAFGELMALRGQGPVAAGEATVQGRDPFHPTPFRVGDTTAAVLAAVGVAANDLWQQRGGRWFLPHLNLPHLNLPHLSQRVLDVLQCESTPEAVRAAVGRRAASSARDSPSWSSRPCAATPRVTSRPAARCWRWARPCGCPRRHRAGTGPRPTTTPPPIATKPAPTASPWAMWTTAWKATASSSPTPRFRQTMKARALAASWPAGRLDAARASGRTVVPRCSFIAAYLRRHPDELALVRPEVRRELGL